jgi:hypothetical protein
MKRNPNMSDMFDTSMTPIATGWRYTTPLEQRVYRPPAEPEPFVAPRFTSSAVNVDGTVIEKADAVLTHASDSFQKHVGTTNEHRAFYTDEGFRDQIAKFSETSAVKAVDGAVTQVLERRDKAAEKVDKVRKDLSPAGDAATELRATRFWNRTQRRLDSLDSGKLFGAATDLIKNSSREELGTLLEEIAPYLESRGVTTDWIEAALGQAVPEYGSALAQLKKANQAATIVDYNAKALRDSIANAANGGYRKPLLVHAGQYDPDR